MLVKIKATNIRFVYEEHKKLQEARIILYPYVNELVREVVRTYLVEKAQKASIFGRLWQKNQGTIFSATFSIIPISPDSLLLTPDS